MTSRNSGTLLSMAVLAGAMLLNNTAYAGLAHGPQRDHAGLPLHPASLE